MTGTFTAHNIGLDNGQFTFPEIGWTIAESPWMTAARRALEHTFPVGVAGRSIVDLGCLEGGYTVEFARMGMRAVGIEVRESNFANCEYVRNSLGLTNLEFVRDDVWNVGRVGRVDAVFCCGLLYHLDRPKAFIDVMAQLEPRILILNTHYATDEPSEKFELGAMVEHEGLAGRWYSEHDEEDESVLEGFKWTSWSNKQSFWLTKASIVEALRQAGFDLIFEQFDWLGNDVVKSMETGYYKTDSRAQFVAIRVQT